MQLLCLAFGCLLMVNLASAATEVELVDCRFTPEVQKELQLTADQVPKATKVFADLIPLRTKIEESRKKRDDLRRSGAGEQKIEAATKELISLEDRCREQTHQMLQPLLTDGQYQNLLEMEEVHHKKLHDRPAATK